jgi:Flp pilus assembly protein TadD
MKRPGRYVVLKIRVLKIIAVCCLAVVLCAAKKAPETSSAQMEFGVEMAKRGLWSEALFRFKQAERLSPGEPSILNNLAVAYEALGRFDKALDYYQLAIKADRTNRDLKRNYSRFIEFYRAFKPDEVAGVPEPAKEEESQ